MDSIVFEESVNTEVSSSEFVDKQWLYVNDNNNGSYSSQVVLDTTPLANSGSYINWSEAFILMPLVLQFESTSANLTATNSADYLGCLKSGYWNMLHSLTCEFNNGNIIQQVPFLNVFCSFKNITSWSKDDLTDWSAVTGFLPDSARTWAYLDAAPSSALNLSGSGSGLTNNRDSPYVDIAIFAFTSTTSAFTGTQVTPVPDPYTPAGSVASTSTTSIASYNYRTPVTENSRDLRQAWNEGFFERQQVQNYNPITSAVNPNSTNQGLLISGANCAQVFRTFVNLAANIRWYAIDAIIRLKDIADFFQKVPMLKGSTMRIYLNTNQAYFQVTATAPTYAAATGAINAQPILSLTASPVILGGGGTNPVMVSSNGLGQGGSVLTFLQSDAVVPVATAVINVAVSIVRTQFQQMPTQNLTCPISSVRLYAPAYTMSPIAEQRYLSLTPTKRVVYNDIFQFSFPNQSVNSPFNILVTNGIPNIRSVLVLPLLPSASNGTAAAGAVKSSTILSPFCSTPSSPDPLIIQNFQVQISGKNLFINQLQYDYETFYEQLVSSNQLNGSLTTSLASGLVSKADFQSLYRYYYGNCSRSLPSEEGVAKAIQIQGTILSPLATAVDLMVFVEFEREVTIDVRTGARIA
jgi:hypothetical protein